MEPNAPENFDLKARLRESLLAQQTPDRPGSPNTERRSK